MDATPFCHRVKTTCAIADSFNRECICSQANLGNEPTNDRTGIHSRNGSAWIAVNF